MVWTHGCFDDLSRFWSADCINHADPSPDTKGLVALRRYHAQFAQVFASFSDVSVDVLQQTAEDDRVVTEMITSPKHTATLNGIAHTGRNMQIANIRIDRLSDETITRQWSMGDMTGFMPHLPNGRN